MPILLLGGIILGILELVTVTALIPLMLLILDPVNAVKGRVLGFLYRHSPADTINEFAILLALVIMMILCCKIILNIVFFKIEFYIIRKWQEKITYQISNVVLYARYDRLQQYVSTKIMSTMAGDISNVMQHYFSELIVVLRMFILSLLFTSFAMLVNFRASMIVFAFGLIMVGLFTHFRRKYLQNLGKKLGLFKEKKLALLQIMILGIKEIKVSLKENYFLRKYHHTARKSAKLELDLLFSYNLPSLFAEFIALFVILSTFVVLIILSQNIQDAVIQISILMFLGMRFIPLMSRSVTSLAWISSTHDSINKVLTIYDDLSKDGEMLPDVIKPVQFDKQLKFDNISYHYNKDKKNAALDNVSLQIEKGQHIGIVGPSGSGKSTVIHIIMGFLQNYQGSYYIDEQKITADNVLALRKLTSFVDQHPFLMNDSYLANVAYGEEVDEIDEARVCEQLQKVGLLEHVMKSKDGLNSIIGENGRFLSGGQRQRLAIARAFYRKSQILILDEASSALDMDSEAELTALLETFKNDVTIISIAHRLSTLKHCDKLFFLTSGEIAAQGTFQKLYKNHDIFKRYVKQSNIDIDE
ncbi:MAG: ABC transporter ATP-binding protein/permease [Alphaproteobacteria bacterium]|nr:ABC transporter ATP-binding protein/permease [Alphaproteobacteria bacterium]